MARQLSVRAYILRLTVDNMQQLCPTALVYAPKQTREQPRWRSPSGINEVIGRLFTQDTEDSIKLLLSGSLLLAGAIHDLCCPLKDFSHHRRRMQSPPNPFTSHLALGCHPPSPSSLLSYLSPHGTPNGLLSNHCHHTARIFPLRKL